MNSLLSLAKKIIPKKIFRLAQPLYHYTLALLGAIIYGFPGKKMVIVGVTGTKGKTTTVEIVNAILEEAGYTTALAGTLRFKIGNTSKRNLFKMSMPGRFFMQKFLSEALRAGCSHVVLEMTSEGAKQFRHKFIYPDALIFTNLAPEHIESHGSYEKYLAAKLSIAKELETSGKKNFDSSSLKGSHANHNFSSHWFIPTIIANADDKEGEKFLALNIKNKIPYSLRDAVNVKADSKGSSFQIGKIVIHSKLPGFFNVYNMLGAIAYAKFADIPDEKIKKALEKIGLVRGRMEKIVEGQNFDVVVDYAHTPDSLRAVYETYTSKPTPEVKYKLICVLGNTGGGRDTWKRPEMGQIADQYCDEIILTNEDPYDEDPMNILKEMKAGIKNKPVEIILDRRLAIKTALTRATASLSTPPTQSAGNKLAVAVLITGKGTDPYIMGPNGTKEEWDDASVVREELKKLRAGS
jgi:UDP-N-acetylmuramoyl-L-alanyl-D-glutamate--2,6-diaminopimelate ligase